jgi:P27 family predicted phage terminase small subunit
MARPRKLVDVNKKNFTKEELDKRKEEEKKLDEFKKLEGKKIPSELGRVGKEEWKRLTPLMENLPVSELDRNLLVMYCRYYELYLLASKEVSLYGISIEEDRGGIIVRKQNPSLTSMLSMTKEIKSIASSLGLTINSRLQILGTNKEEEDDNDPFKDFL